MPTHPLSPQSRSPGISPSLTHTKLEADARPHVLPVPQPPLAINPLSGFGRGARAGGQHVSAMHERVWERGEARAAGHRGRVRTHGSHSTLPAPELAPLSGPRESSFENRRAASKDIKKEKREREIKRERRRAEEGERGQQPANRPPATNVTSDRLASHQRPQPPAASQPATGNTSPATS